MEERAKKRARTGTPTPPLASPGSAHDGYSDVSVLGSSERAAKVGLEDSYDTGGNIHLAGLLTGLRSTDILSYVGMVDVPPPPLPLGVYQRIGATGLRVSPGLKSVTKVQCVTFVQSAWERSTSASAGRP